MAFNSNSHAAASPSSYSSLTIFNAVQAAQKQYKQQCQAQKQRFVEKQQQVVK